MNMLRLLRKLKLRRPRAVKASADRFEIVLSGSGGQGIVLAGRILAEAASLYDHKEAVMSQSYGPEARGGASKAEIIISGGEIDYPKAMVVNVLLVMTQEAMGKYAGLLSPEGLLIVDETMVKEVPRQFKNVFKVPFSGMAVNTLHAQIVANIIALGSLAAITKVVSREALIRAVLNTVPDKALVLDRVAVDMGFKAVREKEKVGHP